MNKQNINKLELFLTGLIQRMIDNVDFFKQITAEYKSGTKVFNALIMLDEKNVVLNFNGKIDKIDIDKLNLTLCEIAINYESVNIIYEERGINIYIEADNKNVKMKTKETELVPKIKSETSQVGNREYYIKVGQADSLLKEIGIMGSNGKIKNDMIRKYNQIDHFVELIDDMLKDITNKNESITILDCGCGKSYLTFVLNYYIKEVLKKSVHFIGLDSSTTVIEASKKMAANLGYKNMEFIATDIRGYKPTTNVHLMVSLHACDTATDEALAFGINNNVKAMVLVPCCHRELLSQYSYKPFEPLIKHGLFKARMADLLTDSMRTLFLEALGYKTQVVEYISPLETPKNLMIKADKIFIKNEKLMDEYIRIKNVLNVSPLLENLVILKNKIEI